MVFMSGYSEFQKSSSSLGGDSLNQLNSVTAIYPDGFSYTRCQSRRLMGYPFQVLKAVPVDLFHQTPYCELILLLEREKQAAGSGEGQGAEATVAGSDGVEACKASQKLDEDQRAASSETNIGDLQEMAANVESGEAVDLDGASREMDDKVAAVTEEKVTVEESAVK